MARKSIAAFAAALIGLTGAQPVLAQGFGNAPYGNSGNPQYDRAYQDGYNDAFRQGYGTGYDDGRSARRYDDTDYSYGYGNGPYNAPYGANVSFAYFYNELAPYGRWYRHPRWGDVWHPVQVEANFRPYFRGHWINTVEFGWTWNSDYPWSDVPFHYGRWVYDPYDGWLWVPGYVWSPAWVVWRSGAGNVGWFPMPPDDRFLAGFDEYRTDWDWNRGFGYRDWYGPSFALNTLLSSWIFTDFAHFGDRDYGRYLRPQNQYVSIINNTRNVTNYVTVNNRFVNRSIDVTQVERASGRRIERVTARDVVKTPITGLDVGRQVQGRERQGHGGNPNASARERIRPLPAADTGATPPAFGGRGGRLDGAQPAAPANVPAPVQSGGQQPAFTPPPGGGSAPGFGARGGRFEGTPPAAQANIPAPVQSSGQPPVVTPPPGGGAPPAFGARGGRIEGTPPAAPTNVPAPEQRVQQPDPTPPPGRGPNPAFGGRGGRFNAPPPAAPANVQVPVQGGNRPNAAPPPTAPAAPATEQSVAQPSVTPPPATPPAPEQGRGGGRNGRGGQGAAERPGRDN